MKNKWITCAILGGLMVFSSALTKVMTPTAKIADQQPKFSLERMIPNTFSGWELDNSIVPVAVDSSVEAQLNAIYNQTLSRTYINRKGERIMLSIAYGGDQSGEGTQAHRPEFCYTAQGFQLVSNVVSELPTPIGKIPVRRLKAVLGSRIEPITYWLTVGNKATLPGFGRMLTQLSYGLTGVVPDGMLVRVSSLDADNAHAYALQDQFINSLLSQIDNNARIRLTGRLSS
ncbi:EpsI family protein [Glaciimonas sp. CA11.2]|uniref:exosortase-associated protein EpsI, B-type n=1 Tax=Glaciimonas sp. CA11.2 TaxID=3048601 RepID=UPI002AB471DC|nr:exosortase-associated protein EpsI, B-type [Glaciimonas sp. CA11.2]MDY7547877.1 EpsI family protein [Glaciimonas sp. CA11.2]